MIRIRMAILLGDFLVAAAMWLCQYRWPAAFKTLASAFIELGIDTSSQHGGFKVYVALTSLLDMG